MHLSALDATTFAETALTRAGAPQAHAAIQAELLVEAELRGVASHGLLRLQRIVERIEAGLIDPRAAGRHEWAGRALLHVDGNRGLGPVVALAALEAIAARAGETGAAVATIRNNNHLGMLAWYVDRMAAAGLVCLAFTTSEALVHPWGGTEAQVGTNPVAIGVPATPRPFVMDLATSLVSMGKIHDHANRHEPIPAGWALDAEGRPTTDAEAAKGGSIAPFGGAKGYALGLAIEVLVTSLAGSAVGTDVRGTLDALHPCNKGDVFVVVQPRTGEPAAGRIGAYLDAVRASRPASRRQPVRVPGDGASARRELSLTAGIEVADDVWAGLQAVAERQRAKLAWS